MKNIAPRVMAAVMAVWAAWTLGGLARDLGEGLALKQALEEAIAETGQELDVLEAGETDVSELAKGMGYISRGDIVFFDGG